MSRESLSYSLAAIATELKEIELERYESTMNALAMNLAEYPGFESWQTVQRENQDGRTSVDFWNEVRSSDRTTARLKKISEALKMDRVTLESQGNLGTRSVDPLTTLLDALKSQVEALSGKVETSIDGGPVRPLLSEELDRWTLLRHGLQIDEKKVVTDQNRINDFKAFAGDKPLNKYVFTDFQAWSNLLVRVPQNHMKLPAIREKSRQEAAEYNDALPLKKRLPTLSEKTIDNNYLSPLRLFFKIMAAEHQFRSPLSDADVRISGAATASIQRVPFNVTELNQWFAHCAGEARADGKWLPLLATITGARIGELVYLQGKDVHLMDADDGSSHWVIDLRTDIDIGGGESEKRKIKNKGSRRLIALHEVFVDVGFIDYVQTRKSGEWLFPAAFRFGKQMVKDPADAASKRMVECYVM